LERATDCVDQLPKTLKLFRELEKNKLPIIDKLYIMKRIVNQRKNPNELKHN